MVGGVISLTAYDLMFVEYFIFCVHLDTRVKGSDTQLNFFWKGDGMTQVSPRSCCVDREGNISDSGEYTCLASLVDRALLRSRSMLRNVRKKSRYDFGETYMRRPSCEKNDSAAGSTFATR